MSELSKRHILLVGEVDKQATTLEDELKSHGVRVTKTICENMNTAQINELGVDLIIFNHAHKEDFCEGLKDILSGAYSAPLVPVFARVNDDEFDIQSVLSRGATDYITDTEDAKSVIEKISALFREDDTFSGSTAIDLTPTEMATASGGIRVFIVEDDPLLRNLLSIRFDKSSFPYEFSNDGIDVVPSLKHFKPDVIILDLMLPGRSGFDVLAEIKANDFTKKIPVIVFSNRDEVDDRKRANELGAVGFFVKAMTDLSELVETIESTVRGRTY